MVLCKSAARPAQVDNRTVGRHEDIAAKTAMAMSSATSCEPSASFGEPRQDLPEAGRRAAIRGGLERGHSGASSSIADVLQPAASVFHDS